jgi:hypothetical protein
VITIITKIELESLNIVKFTEVGYTGDSELIDSINKNYDETLGSFLAENRTKLENEEINVSTFFSETDYVNEARTEVNTLEGRNLIEIKDINDL